MLQSVLGDQAFRRLAEDKVLKQKFDDIFASAKYTKALDDIRALKNNMKKEEKAKEASAGAASNPKIPPGLTRMQKGECRCHRLPLHARR